MEFQSVPKRVVTVELATAYILKIELSLPYINRMNCIIFAFSRSSMHWRFYFNLTDLNGF